ncbi:replication initiator [Streptomyces cavernicola]|uniref:Replication initiation protein n=1 Tax=Streptomyces cavernicola TaxID=3043613 RepID=A0ABT6SLK6_9ACTN|nr:replication initiator [Streptomyces sp. B-S-A6]MDI3408855.1 replication initiation protein [Streptomyces sp. B-S-A6]
MDLSHVASPALRELLTHLNDGTFDAVRHGVEQARGCTAPIQLAGWTETVHAVTGRALRSFNTADTPTGRILIACNNRRASRCPSCARLYAGDTYQLIRAGVVGGKNTPEQVRTHPRVFATLTAPSFGTVHGRVWRNRPGCVCGTHHADDDPVLGTPLHPSRYDYTGSVLFNAHAGQLWGRFTTYLRRYLARLLHMTQKDLAAELRVSFAKVAEYQKRGVVHYHAIIRLDGPDGGTTPPPDYATAALLAKAVKLAARHVTLTVHATQLGERTFKWGRQIDVRQIAADDGKGRLTAEAVAGYIAKYATKGAEDSGMVDRPVRCGTCKGTGTTTTPHDDVTDPCDACTGTGREALTDLPVDTHVRQMIRTCWDLGAVPELDGLNLRKWAHMLGFRGHFSTKSRRYSTTLGALREERRAWRQAQREPLELEDCEQPADAADGQAEEPTTLVVSDWTFLGIGYTPGEQLLAAQVRHERQQAHEQKQRTKTEGELWQS